MLALILNAILLLGAMSLFNATLTLPGIAGFILTIGMAVDSNVLIFERIREELRAGRAPKTAIENGFSKAFATIIDTHITVIISAIFLLPVRHGAGEGFRRHADDRSPDLRVHRGLRVAHGFRARIRPPPAHRRAFDLAKKGPMELFRQTNIDFLRWKWWAIGASWALILVGLLSIFVQKGLKFGIDFAGGTQIALRFRQRPDIDRLRKLLDSGNFGDNGIQRYEAPEKNEVLIRVQQQKKEGRDITAEVLALLRQGLGAAADPARLDLNIQGRDNLAARLLAADPDRVVGKPGTNPADYYARVAEAVIAQRSRMGIFQSPADVDGVSGITPAVKEWVKANTTAGPFVLLSAESVGPQVGADLRKTALWAIATSILGMLIYIAWRFRSLPFGVGAVVALIHDTLITVGLLALFGPRVQPRRRGRDPDPRRLLGQRHGRRLRPDP